MAPIVDRQGRAVALLSVDYQVDVFLDRLRELDATVLQGSAAGALCALILGLLFARRLTRPISALTGAVARVAGGDLSQSLAGALARRGRRADARVQRDGRRAAPARFHPQRLRPLRVTRGGQDAAGVARRTATGWPQAGDHGADVRPAWLHALRRARRSRPGHGRPQRLSRTHGRDRHRARRHHQRVHRRRHLRRVRGAGGARRSRRAGGGDRPGHAARQRRAEPHQRRAGPSDLRDGHRPAHRRGGRRQHRLRAADEVRGGRRRREPGGPGGRLHRGRSDPHDRRDRRAAVRPGRDGAADLGRAQGPDRPRSRCTSCAVSAAASPSGCPMPTPSPP